jgi:hypothetical protein
MRYSAGSMGRSRLALAPDKIRRVEESRVPLPAGVRQPFTVFVNGVRQELGVDYRVSEGELVFSRELVKEGRLGFWRWFLGAWGIGTYRRNDQVDVAWEADGRPQVAHALDITRGAPDSQP